MTILKSFCRILNLQTLIITLLSVISTWLCTHFQITANFPLTIIATAIVFPIVFSIGGAYKRRENSLDEYGVIKAHARSIYFSARDWVPEPDAKIQLEAKEIISTLFQNCRQLFNTPIGEMEDREYDVYTSFSKISQFIKNLESKGLPASECGRCSQYLNKMIAAFENIKHIYQYRTPRTLRADSLVFIYVLPILYGPYFAFISTDFSPGLEYVTPILFTLILVCLHNIQDHLENPFDLVGEDDVIINAEKFVDSLDQIR